MGKQDPTNSQVIAHLKSVFARHGIPKALASEKCEIIVQEST